MPDPERTLSLDGAPLGLPFLVFVLLPLVLEFDAEEELEVIDEVGAVGAGVLAGIGVYIFSSDPLLEVSNVLNGSLDFLRLFVKQVYTHVWSHQVLCMNSTTAIDDSTVVRDNSIRRQKPKRNHNLR